MQQRIAVLGVGAIGATIGGFLSRAGRDVTLIDQWPANVEAIRQHGLTVSTPDEEFTARPTALHLCDVSAAGTAFDVVVLAVKSYDTVWSVRFIEPYLAPRGYIVSAQNGVNDDTIADLIGWPRVVPCVVLFGASLQSAGHVRYTSSRGGPSFTVGEPSGLMTPRLTELATLLGDVGITNVTSNIWGERWAKLAINCMYAVPAAIAGIDSVEVRTNPVTCRVAILVAGEVVRVGSASGVSVEAISGIEAEHYARALHDEGAISELASRLIAHEQAQAAGGASVGAGHPSLAQDLKKGRKIEVDYLNGHVARKGAELGIPTPANDAIVSIAKQVESGALQPSLSNLQLMG